MKTKNIILLESIRDEKLKRDFCYSKHDKKILNKIFKQISDELSINVKYLCELYFLEIPGCGSIINQYIREFESETVKAYIVHHIVDDRIKDCERILLNLYYSYKKSSEYIGVSKCYSPFISVIYDNLFKQLKPKTIAHELIELGENPFDYFSLPLTMRMVASWKMYEMYELSVLYLSEDISYIDNFLAKNHNNDWRPTPHFIKRQITFTAIDNLKYFQSNDSYKILKKLSNNTDDDIRYLAKKFLIKWDNNHR